MSLSPRERPLPPLSQLPRSRGGACSSHRLPRRGKWRAQRADRGCLPLEGKGDRLRWIRWMYLPLISLLRRQLSTPPSVGFADIFLRWRESSPWGKTFSSLSVLPQGRGLLLPRCVHYRVVENQSLPLTREVSKPQVLTEGEKTDGLQYIQAFLSLSLLRRQLPRQREPFYKTHHNAFPLQSAALTAPPVGEPYRVPCSSRMLPPAGEAASAASR